MSNQQYSINFIKSKCTHNNNGSINITDLSNGLLSFSWLDLPKDATITDYGKAIYNLGCGIYTLQIYHIVNKTTESVSIDMSCPEPLSIDMVHIDELMCYHDTPDMTIEWSGGQPPYSLNINNDNISTSSNSYVYKIKANYNYNIILSDHNGCSVSKNNIQILSQPLRADIRWEPITQYLGVSSDVYCKITGGKEPYKIAWFQSDNPKPIIINQIHIESKLGAGEYRVVIKDSNDCQLEQDFTITQPSPIYVNISTFNDYSTKALYEEVEANTIYNLLLIPHNQIDSHQIIESDFLLLKNGPTEYENRLCMDYGVIEIQKQKYDYYYISPGIIPIKNTKIKLIHNNKEYLLDSTLNNDNGCKIIKGSIIINNDHSFAYKNQDIIRITNDKQQTIDSQINQVYIKSGLYFSNNIYTIFNFEHDIGVLEFINKNKQKLYTQSLTTKSNNRLGSIRCYVVNADKASLEAKLINEHNESCIYSFNNKNQLTISNLTYGTYKLRISDANSVAYNYNQKNITDDFYHINILDSFESERNQSMILSSNTYNIDRSLLNVYNHPPNKLLFSAPEYKNGVLMNISPIDACFEIIGDNINIKDCGYKIIDTLPFGKYDIKIFKEGYKTQNINLFYNTRKELVTVILDKE